MLPMIFESEIVANLPFDLHTEGFKLHTEVLEDGDNATLAQPYDAEKEVLRIDKIMVESIRIFTHQTECTLHSRGKPYAFITHINLDYSIRASFRGTLVSFRLIEPF